MANGFNLYSVSKHYSQESSTSKDGWNDIKICTDDAGGGPFIVLEGERWEIDSTPYDILEFVDAMVDVLRPFYGSPDFKSMKEEMEEFEKDLSELLSKYKKEKK